MKKAIKALVFDAYGTLFDVHSVISTCNQLFPGQGPALSQMWCAKQLEYTQLACKKLRVAKVTIGFVSFNCWDIMGAKNFGFWTCWVHGPKAPQDELGFTPDVVANSLTDLVQATKA